MTLSSTLFSTLRATPTPAHQSPAATTAHSEPERSFDRALATARQLKLERRTPPATDKKLKPPEKPPSPEKRQSADSGDVPHDSSPSASDANSGETTTAAHKSKDISTDQASANPSPSPTAVSAETPQITALKASSSDLTDAEKVHATATGAVEDPKAISGTDAAIQASLTTPSIPSVPVEAKTTASVAAGRAANETSVASTEPPQSVPTPSSKTAPTKTAKDSEALKPDPQQTGDLKPDAALTKSLAVDAPKKDAPRESPKKGKLAASPATSNLPASIQEKQSKHVEADVHLGDEAPVAIPPTPALAASKQSVKFAQNTPNNSSAQITAAPAEGLDQVSNASVTAFTAAQIEDVAKASIKSSSPVDSLNKSETPAGAGVSTNSSAPILKSSAATDRASSASAAQDSPSTDPSSAFDQIVLGLHGKIDARNGKAEIRLDPPNLGTVRVSVNLDHGTLTAQFQSSSDVVRELLKSNMEKLKTVLQSQGITVDKLAVGSSTAPERVAENLPSPSPNAAANDGRSAGQYQQNGADRKRPQKESAAFSRAWQDANADAAPIDLVA